MLIIIFTLNLLKKKMLIVLNEDKIKIKTLNLSRLAWTGYFLIGPKTPV